MTDIKGTVERYLNEARIVFETIQDGIFCADINDGKGSVYKLGMVANEQERSLTILLLNPLNVPTDYRRRISEYVLRVNFTLSYGRFELDMDDGEFRYTCRTHIFSDDFPESEVGFMLDCGIDSFKRCRPGLVAIINRGMTPKTACEMISGQR